jgi:hypothetical protein
MRNAALTLLEILLATTLLAFVTIALGTWLRVVGRASAQSGRLTEQERAWSAIVRLLKADLGGRVSSLTIAVDGHSIRFATINCLPGEPAQRRLALWACSAQGLGLEEPLSGAPDAAMAVPIPRSPIIATYSPSPSRFRMDDQGTLWLDLAAETSVPETPVNPQAPGKVPSIPLWREWH